LESNQEKQTALVDILETDNPAIIRSRFTTKMDEKKRYEKKIKHWTSVE